MPEASGLAILGCAKQVWSWEVELNHSVELRKYSGVSGGSQRQ